MAYELPDSRVQFPKLEFDIRGLWKKEKTFEESLRLHTDEHVFYDGPPFPTGTPHHGTIFVSILKDSLARYFTMAGKSVPRRWGWDCHGLPIENAIEKKLAIATKADIEKVIGVEAFNAACRAHVSECNDAWEEYIDKIGRWVDYDNAYRTLDTTYMESVLWVFQECYKRELIYKDYRVTPFCYKCETSLSISDTRESDSTRPRQDPSVVVRFRAKDDVAGKPTYFLAWTTTPWTLVANMALAVGPEFSYVAVDNGSAVFIVAADLVEKVTKALGGNLTEVARFSGRELVGRTYEPLFSTYAELAASGCFRIVAADFVTLVDGVGIVHLAPAFGEDDYWTCRREGIAVRNPVDAGGRYTAEVEGFAGKNVHDVNKDIIRKLKEEGKVVLHDTIEHNYPHCWRCRTPLIYRAMDAWYFAVEKIKPRLIKAAEEINWVPEHVKAGRFGKWLEGARDWNISRSRYWGTPIPVWECSDCAARRVLGSLDEIFQASGTRVHDLHKEHVDGITFACEKCSGTMRRVPEVLDCWFESGAMPFGQCHYPFENRQWFEEHFPADFIVEYPGQIRCWFYYLHVLAVALFDRPAFKNCLVHGTLLAEDGSKISKSRKNYTDPMALIDKYGADPLRIYLLGSPAASMLDMNFKDTGIDEQIKAVLLPLWNAYSFFVTYANADGFQGDPARIPGTSQALDRWILTLLRGTVLEIGEAFSTYHLNRSLTPAVEFLENLTNWYIRCSRERFWVANPASGLSDDKRSAYEVLYYCLVTFAKILAPSAPFISDHIFRKLTGGTSVHVASWPDVSRQSADESQMVVRVALARKITTMGLALRQKARLRVRQPLAEIYVALPRHIAGSLLDDQVDVVLRELNIKKLHLMDDPSHLATLRAKPNAKLLGPKLGRDMQVVIKAAREGHVEIRGDQVLVRDGEREWLLENSEIEVGYEGREGRDVMSDSGVLVALETTLTPDLLEEGIANDLNRSIQDLRKESGFAVTDRIIVDLEGSLSEASRRMLAESCLASFASVAAADAEGTFTREIEGQTFVVRVKRVS